MAERPIKEPLPADLPENWQAEQIVAPTGEEVGLSRQHGYNYLMEMVNRAQRGVNSVNEAFETVSGRRTCRFTVGTSKAGWTAADCDYLCDGTDDQVEIQAAIDALDESGGRGKEIVLLGGRYSLTGPIIMQTGVTLRGNGDSTVLQRETSGGEGTVNWIIYLGSGCVLSDLCYSEKCDDGIDGYPIFLAGESKVKNVYVRGGPDSSGGSIYVALAKNASFGGFAEISNCVFWRGGAEKGDIHLFSGGDVRVLNNITSETVLLSSSPDCSVHLLARGNTGVLLLPPSIRVDGLGRGSMILGNELNDLSFSNTGVAEGVNGSRTLGRECLISGNVFRALNSSSTPTIALGAGTAENFVTGNLICGAETSACCIEDNGTDNIIRFNSNDLTGSGGTPASVSQAVPSISVTEGGLVTASATQAAGNVSAGTKSATRQLSAQDDPDLTPENIREGVSIFGVRGTLSGAGGVTSETISAIVTLTETEYNALSAKDPAVLYLIKE